MKCLVARNGLIKNQTMKQEDENGIALNTEAIKSLLDWYVEKKTWEDAKLERYKWEAFCWFEEFYYSELPIEKRIELAFSRADNLLASSSYYPLGMLRHVIPHYPYLLDILYDESVDLKKRIGIYTEKFGAAVKEMTRSGYYDWDKKGKVSHHQDVRAISVYLSMRYPERYYLYKFEVFCSFAKCVGYEIVHHSRPDAINRLLEYFDFCDAVKVELLKNKEFVKYYKAWLKDNRFSDPSFNLLTQDFIYSTVCHRKPFLLPKDVLFLEAKEVSTTDKEQVSTGIVKKVDYVKRDQQRRGLGKDGEQWVMQYEQDRVGECNVKNIASECDTAGYDILSVEDDGSTPRYIEVKTTTGSIDTPFFFSDNELKFSEMHKEHYYLYRLYEYGKAPRLVIIHGSLNDVPAYPVNYKCVVSE